MRHRTKITILFLLAIVLVALFLFTDLRNAAYVLPRRTMKVLAIIVTGTAIALATLIFQTITNNRILTPSMIGLDSLYLLLQTFIIFIFGSTHLTLMNKYVNFGLSLVFMVGFALILYRFLFKKEGQPIYLLLLVGIILGTLFESLSSFMQVLIDPNEFQVVQDKMFASFNNVNTELLYISIGVLVVTFLCMMRDMKYLDVLSLGRSHAVNLGVPYEAVVKRLLIMVTIFIAVATALVGPITFLGLLVVNIAYHFLPTYRHSLLMIGSSLIAIIALVGGQWMVERVFTFSTPISVIINFAGGLYFIHLLLKENRLS
ncbi:iron chelate uptake ABC transporter family permease subunit [Halobacillus karajensis]|uniref:Iron(III)-hydroxamate import system permease protein FhuB n=1 Tax=Halobacillus karajensis TaxID=195088 RepID=A0A024P816_9BACI|nr:iron chelate uptake ABC transporter family permease subunit [Halobacillus karajensis]CDQ20938.1 Iron(III)-hydroxamate import system permease protein FhuB [Halobacillus karajensis]CDQ24998.1 Iron(III)-hydroxamate import system permease protein FhuB [Halobacillus karajensis]CDQ28641.1 Iron(III)-hydroxamate import system permease protein FhuB [Halobacillus karajensis]